MKKTMLVTAAALLAMGSMAFAQTDAGKSMGTGASTDAETSGSSGNGKPPLLNDKATTTGTSSSTGMAAETPAPSTAETAGQNPDPAMNSTAAGASTNAAGTSGSSDKETTTPSGGMVPGQDPK